MAYPIEPTKGAVTWSISQKENAVKLPSPNAEGVGVFEWALSDFSTENVRNWFGFGHFRV